MIDTVFFVVVEGQAAGRTVEAVVEGWNSVVAGGQGGRRDGAGKREKGRRRWAGLQELGGENRARNGVTDCPESRNEENYKDIMFWNSSRSAKPLMSAPRRPRKDVGCLFSRRRFIKKRLRDLFLEKTWINIFKPLLISPPSSPAHHRQPPTAVASHRRLPHCRSPPQSAPTAVSSQPAPPPPSPLTAIAPTASSTVDGGWRGRSEVMVTVDRWPEDRWPEDRWVEGDDREMDDGLGFVMKRFFV
ncbi:hypothetical protein E3N88_23562 [Mikania micrantha]|uniref:Uncharacterized protein n=1 Tax=Mikania micrantha TaxID=192012 RepID=A0A5N6NDL8_9ASTR|nr:hypothetical protein E3N88_23562 [Mikania micrantha]